jgi:uncharacterized membrane protein
MFIKVANNQIRQSDDTKISGISPSLPPISCAKRKHTHGSSFKYNEGEMLKVPMEGHAMNRIFKYFVLGLVTLAPILLTVYIITYLFLLTEGLLGEILEEKTNFYFTGLGVILTIAIIIFIGFMMSNWLGKTIFTSIDLIFQKLPLVRLVYSIIKDTFQSLFGEKKSFSKVALIRLPGSGMKLLGFVTSEDLSALGDIGKDHCAVYILQSMQWAGHTVLVPKEDLEIIDVPVESAMKFIISAGITGQKHEKVKYSTKR